MQLPLEYLTERVTEEQVIAENLHDGRPFGHVHDDWERLKARMQPGDELWNFAPPSRNVMQFMGRGAGS